MVPSVVSKARRLVLKAQLVHTDHTNSQYYSIKRAATPALKAQQMRRIRRMRRQFQPEVAFHDANAPPLPSPLLSPASSSRQSSSQ